MTEYNIPEEVIDELFEQSVTNLDRYINEDRNGFVPLLDIPEHIGTTIDDILCTFRSDKYTDELPRRVNSYLYRILYDKMLYHYS